MDPEFLKALDLVAKYEESRPKITKEFRLYHDNNGVIIGLWQTDYPDGNYIVLDDPTVFNNTSTLLLRVSNGQLKKIDTTQPIQTKLVKSKQGQPVVKGHAALALCIDEQYTDIEYYDRKTDS